MGKPRADIDRDELEKDIRASVLSLRAVGAKHSMSEGAVRKYAKTHKIDRDLGEMVRAKVRADLMRTDGTQMVRPDERGIVDAAAAALVGVTLKHRRIIGETIQIAEALKAQLIEAIASRHEIEATIESATDLSPQQRARMMSAVALPTHLAGIGMLSSAIKTLVTLERQAYGMDRESEPREPKDAGSGSTIDYERLRQRALEN